MCRPRRPLALILGSLLAIPFLAPAARASWPHDPTANVEVCNAGNEQRYPATISDGAGGAIIAWEDQRLNANINIFVQHLSSAGTPQWGNLATGLVVCNATGTQSQPVLCPDGSGGAIVAWADDRSGTWALYAQHVSAAGVAQWTASGVLFVTDLATPFAGGPLGEFGIATDTQGGAYIAWATTANELRIQRLNGSGTALFGVGGIVLENTHLKQYLVSVVPDGSGGAIACWKASLSGQPNDILGQRVNASGTALWAAGALGVCTDPSDQDLPIVTADGQGGAYFAWTDFRSIPSNVYAQHVSNGGTALWTGNGIAVGNTADETSTRAIVGDGSGGAIIAYEDRAGPAGLSAQRLGYWGTARWGANGEAVVGPSQYLGEGEMIADGAGGAIIAWEDLRNGNWDVYAQRLGADGGFLWGYDDVAVCTQPAGQSWNFYSCYIPTLATDGAGGAIIAWEDSRTDAGDIYAQRVERFGRLGDPEPVITKVSDVLADQGGQVSLQWTASYLDVSPTFEIADYSIWREAPAAAAQAALRTGARLLTAAQPRPADAAGTRVFRALPAASGTVYWEYLLSVPARALPGYSHVTPTTTDSTGSSNLLTTFMVMAEDAGGVPFWASAPDSGYAVDNLPPGAPAPFTAAYQSGATYLHWGANTEPDLAGYRLYRGSSATFVPGPGDLISAQADTGFADAGPAGSYYKLSAVDIHGNESAYSLVGPDATTAVGGPGTPRELALAEPRPNPARGRTVVGFAVPLAGSISLGIYDVDGRLVRTLVEGWLDAGQYSVPFDLRGAAGGALAGGVYFERLQAEGRTLVRRLAVLR